MVRGQPRGKADAEQTRGSDRPALRLHEEPERTDVEFDPADVGGLVRPTSAHQVASHIRRMIFTNQLKAGERVPQDEIAAALRVSRVPVREAVIALDREGWVTIEAHRGAFVNGLDEDTVLDHYDILGMLYGFAARRAAERGAPSDMQQLLEINRRFQAADDADEMWTINNEFMRQLLRMTGSRRITALARLLSVNIMPGRYFADVPGVVRVHKRGVGKIVRAIKAGDGPAAEAAYNEMSRAEAVSAVALLKSRGYIAS
jgi:DNA-binding GntR family transcriptional regulator